jgi:hypothetical protein
LAALLVGCGQFTSSKRQNRPFLICSLAPAKNPKNHSSLYYYRGVFSIKENTLLFLLANLTGVIGGAFVLVVLQPQADFFYLLPSFIMLGMIAANMVLALIIELTKGPDAKTMREATKQAS